MKYTNKYIEKLNENKNFIKYNLEKVVRLLDVLDFIYTKVDSNYSKLVLKGGTALNLVHTNLARLSVDIDLDYVGSLEKEETIKERSEIVSLIDNYMYGEGYQISEKSRESAVLASRKYFYTNAFGNRDNIKIEINFIDRVHVLENIVEKVKHFDKEISILVPHRIELFAMKFCALLDRHKPRDLYDANKIIDYFPFIDLDLLKKCIIFYLSLDGIYQVDSSLLKNIQTITYFDLKKELFAVLSKNERFNLDETKNRVTSSLEGILALKKNENLYLEEFSKGNYNPSLLFDKDIGEKLSQHPMAKWRIQNLV